MRTRSSRRAVGLSDIAREVGVTVSTASRALNGYSDIAPDTRQRVQEAAAKLQYRPSSAARRLALGASETIGYVLPSHTDGQPEPFIAEMLQGVSQALAGKDWDLLVSTIPGDEKPVETYRRLVGSGKVSGFILSRIRSRDERIDLLRELGVPFICFGQSAASRGYAYLDIDNMKAFRDAVAHFVEFGHRRIALISADPDYQFAEERRLGYLAGLKAAGLPARAEYVVAADLSPAGGRAAIDRLMALPEPPTAIACITDFVALGAMAALRDRGAKVGRDMSLIGYDGLLTGAYSEPPLSTMAAPIREIGVRITEILMDIVEGAPASDYSELWPARFIKRASVGPPPDR